MLSQQQQIPFLFFFHYAISYPESPHCMGAFLLLNFSINLAICAILKEDKIVEWRISMENETKQTTNPNTVKQSFIELTQAMIEEAAKSPKDLANKPDTMRELRESVRLIMGN